MYTNEMRITNFLNDSAPSLSLRGQKEERVKRGEEESGEAGKKKGREERKRK